MAGSLSALEGCRLDPTVGWEGFYKKSSLTPGASRPTSCSQPPCYKVLADIKNKALGRARCAEGPSPQTP